MIRCSELERVKQCPGSVRLIASLPPMERKETEDSERGTRIHRAVKDLLERDMALSNDEEESVFALSYSRRVKDELRLWRGVDDLKPYCEEELSCPGLTGHPDVYFRDEASRSAIVLDYKTGWGDVPQADRNLQLRGYALLLYCDGIDKVRSVLLERNGTSRCDYSALDLSLVSKEIGSIISASKAEDAPLHAGEHCRYCPANGSCVEAAKYALRLPRTVPVPASMTMPVGDYALCLTPNEIAAFLSKWPVVQKIAEAIKDRAKAMASNGADLPWTLKPGVKRAVVTDVIEAWNKMSRVLTPTEFSACCTVKIGEVEKKVAEVEGSSLKDAKNEVRTILADVIVYKEAAPTLQLKGEE